MKKVLIFVITVLLVFAAFSQGAGNFSTLRVTTLNGYMYANGIGLVTAVDSIPGGGTGGIDSVADFSGGTFGVGNYIFPSGGYMQANNLRLQGNTMSSTTGNIILDPASGVSIASGHNLSLAGGAVQVGGNTVISSSRVLSGTQVNADNLRLDGNTLSSQNTNGNITINPNGSGIVIVSSPLNVEGNFTQQTGVGSGTTANSLLNDIVIDSDATAGMSILTPNNAFGFYGFGDSDDNYVGGIRYSNIDNDLSFRTNDDIRVIIDSVGQLIVNDLSGTGTRLSQLNASGTLERSSIQVSGDDVTFAGNVTASGNATFNSPVLVNDGGGGANDGLVVNRRLTIDGGTSTGTLTIRDNTDTETIDFLYRNDGGDSYMLATSGGQLGIGHTAPDKTLDVNGTFEATGVSTFGDDVTFTGNATIDNNLPELRLDEADQSRVFILQQTGGNFRIRDETSGIIALQAAGGTGDVTITQDLQLSDYGTGTNTGTAAYSLAVDASGNVIEQNYKTEFVTEEINTGTSDGNDNKRISISGGGAANNTARGASIILNGNEFATNSGDAIIRSGLTGDVVIGSANTTFAEREVFIQSTPLSFDIAPTTPSTETSKAKLFAAAISSTTELRVIDGAGNITTISPHNFSKIPDGASEEMAWSFYSERDGKYVTVDMLRVVRLLEQITGEKLVYTGTIDKN
jgi:hypothetical protein